MKQKALKTKMKKGKTAVIFPDRAVSSINMFIHCSRIPDIMVHVVKIREIYRRHKIPAPAYLFGLPSEKGSLAGSNLASSDRNFHLMSFVVSLGLYDRFLRLRGLPDLLIGGSPALLVSARVKNYEKTVIRMICSAEGWAGSQSIRVYQSQRDKTEDSHFGMRLGLKFSLLYFSRTVGRGTWPNLIKEHKVRHCISLGDTLSSLSRKRKATASTAGFSMEGLMETDPQLAWLLPILKKNRSSRGKIISPAFRGSDFH